MIAFSMIPLAYLTAGPLSDRVFKPFFEEGSVLASALGPIWGSGPVRGVGLLIFLMGLSIVLMTVATALNPRVRNLEQELPDGV
jgi:hypothetical protein